jgi:hypothetical protein
LTVSIDHVVPVLARRLALGADRDVDRQGNALLAELHLLRAVDLPAGRQVAPDEQAVAAVVLDRTKAGVLDRHSVDQLAFLSGEEVDLLERHHVRMESSELIGDQWLTLRPSVGVAEDIERGDRKLHDSRMSPEACRWPANRWRHVAFMSQP